jgi:lysophospholipase L1-like esterase
LGDSITASWEHPGRHDYDNIRPLWLKYYAPYGALDLGIPGDTTSNLIWRLYHGQVAGLHPQLVIILIGANNIKGPPLGASETVPGIEKVVSITRANLPDSHVLLLGVLPAARSVWGYQQTSIVNMTLAKDYANDPNVTFVDAGSTLLVDGRADSSLYLDPKMVPPRGALHPDAAGMAKIAAFIDSDVKRFTK